MTVLISERKGAVAIRSGRTPFDELLKTCTTLMIGCPLDDESRNMITEVELQTMRKDSTLINVARGGIVGEEALVKALREGWIANAATDVFEIEPATLTSTPLISDFPPNLTLSPHLAWYADASVETLQGMITSNLESYISGQPQNVVT
jgi:phosphoglycerate dehydrogenase-like enzyme